MAASVTALITCACPERCEIHPVDRGRRFFLMGALALPVAAKLAVPELAVPELAVPTVFPLGVYSIMISTGLGQAGSNTVVFMNGREVARWTTRQQDHVWDLAT